MTHLPAWSASLVLVVTFALTGLAGPAGAAPMQDGEGPSTTQRELPRTGLEAEELDQGSGGAGWMAASAAAAAVTVLAGGLVLKRRADREDLDGRRGPAT